MFKPTKKFIFVLRHVVFAALSIFFLESWHADFGLRTDVERRAFSYANHVTARIVADSYGDMVNNGPFFPKARLVNYDMVQFVYLTPEDGPQVKTLCFGSDILPDVLWRFWVVMLLFLFICPFENYSVGVRLCMALVSGIWCCFFFLCRAVILGELSHGIDIVAYIRLIDIPLRAFLLLSVWIVALLTARILTKFRADGRTASRTGGVVAVLVLLCLLGGCGGSFSNNSVSINVTGGDGSAPYIAIVAFIAGSLISNFRNGRRDRGAEAGELPRVRVASVEEGAVGEIVKGIVPHLGGRPRKGRQPAFTQKAVAVLCGKDVNTVARWESGAIKPPLDYTAELRMKGGVGFFDWVREYNAHNGVADIFIQIRKGNVAYTEGLTEREKGLVEEYIQALRQG